MITSRVFNDMSLISQGDPYYPILNTKRLPGGSISDQLKFNVVLIVYKRLKNP